MTFDKNITIVSSLLITGEEGVSNERLRLVRERLGSVDGCVNEEAGQKDFRSLIEVLVGNEEVRLRASHLDERATVGISFHEGATNHRRLYGGGKSQHLAKAVGIDQKKDLNILDATAGLAADSFVLASIGANVRMLERSPLLVLMIEEALVSARLHAASQGETGLQLVEIIDRMSVIQTDAIDWLSRQAQHSCDVVFLDPMFPERKKKAAVKKEMQILQQLFMEKEKNESERLEEEAELLNAALSMAVHRVVVKRPRHAPCVTGAKPGYSLEGKSTRFDIYPLKKII